MVYYYYYLFVYVLDNDFIFKIVLFVGLETTVFFFLSFCI